MDKHDMQATWQHLKSKLQQQYNILNESDLRYEEGQELQLLERIKGRLRLPMKDVKKIIARL